MEGVCKKQNKKAKVENSGWDIATQKKIVKRKLFSYNSLWVGAVDIRQDIMEWKGGHCYQSISYNNMQISIAIMNFELIFS